MHLNSCLMIGRVSAKGPQLRYAESGTPFCSFVLEVDELNQGKVYTTYIPCEIGGKYAESSAEEIEPGDVLQISGKWKYKSSVDQKSGVKVSKPVVSSWGVSQRIPALSESPGDDSEAEGPLSLEGHEEIVDPEHSQTRTPKRQRLKTQGPKWTGKISALQN